MRLILSTRTPRNCTYFTETGEVLYVIDEPFQLISPVATIRKAAGIAGSVLSVAFERSPNSYGQHSNPALGGSHWAGPNWNRLAGFEQHLISCAQVEFRKFYPSHFRYNGVDVSVKEYFREEGWWKGMRRRVFTASDGKEYRWRLHPYYPEMVTNDARKIKVVEFKQPHRVDPSQKGRLAFLEINPSCVPILDEVIMTFIYCQKLREGNEGDSGGGDGGGGGGDGDGGGGDGGGD